MCAVPRRGRSPSAEADPDAVSPHVELCGEASGEAVLVLFCCPDNSAGADAMKSGVFELPALERLPTA